MEYKADNFRKMLYLRRFCAVLMSVAMVLMCVQVYTQKVYAELPELQEVSTSQYYGKNALRNMDNGENLVYVYEQIVEGVGSAQESISLYDGTHYVSPTELVLVYETYMNDYPQHFWINNGYSYRYSGNIVISFSPKYSSVSDDLETAKEAFDEEIAEVISGIDASMSEFERELIIHDRLAERITYVADADNAHNAYGAVVEGEAVCDGYSRAFQYALYKVGIFSMTVTGDAGGGHAWNLVEIDDKYYYTDLSWNDSTSRTYHAYFNLPLSEMSKDHTIESDFELPECNSWDANYFTIFGGRIDEYTVDSFVEVLNKNLTADIYLTCDTSQFWTWFQENISEIATKCGITSGFSYGYTSMANERIVYINDASRSTISVTGVSISQSSYEFSDIGETVKLSAAVMPTNAQNQTITFSSANTDVAIVDKYTGLVTSVGAGTTDIIATSEDGEKTAVCKVTVKSNELSASIDVNGCADTLECKVGDSVKVSVLATGGSESYTYKYVIKNVATGQTVTLRNYSEADAYTGTMNSVGTKQFIVYVKDSNGTVVQTNAVTVITTAVEEELSASLKVNGSTQTVNLSVGDEVTVVPTATGGSGSYTYKYVIKNVATGQTVTLKNYSSTTSYTGTMNSVGTKQFIVYVKDSNGNIVQTNAVNVVTSEDSGLSASLKVNDSSSAINLTIGDVVNVVPTVTGGSGSYTYKYIIKNVATGQTATLKNYSSIATYTGTMSSVGTKQFIVYVKDSAGNIVQTNSVTVVTSEEGELSAVMSINDSSDTLNLSVGDKVTLLSSATGGSGDYTYKYVIKNVATKATVTLKNYSSDISYTGTMTSAGTKDFYVYVKDSEGNIVQTNSVRVVVS